jgi:hypothetical protein
VVSGEHASHVDTEDSDSGDGADADADGDPTETGEGDVTALDCGPAALGRAGLPESSHAVTVRVDPDA